MTPYAVRRLTAYALTSSFIAPAAFAGDCKLARLATLDFTEHGAIVVPVSLEGKTMPMALDTGAPLSAIDPVVATNLGIDERRMFQGALYDMKGEPFTYLATLRQFGLGDMHASNVKMLVWPSHMTGDGSIAGTLAVDMLRHYDIDIDFGAHKLSLFSQDHCPGKVVYWTSDNVAVVPMHVVNSGHIILPVTLDGHEVDAVLDTGSTRSLLSMEFAHNLFGLNPDSPDMEKTGDISGAVQTKVYRRTFKTLSFGGLTINNPEIYIWDNLMKYTATQAAPTGSRLSDVKESGGNTDFTLGMNELRHLHVYIAYQEQKLYITAASAPAAANDQPSPTLGPTGAH